MRQTPRTRVVLSSAILLALLLPVVTDTQAPASLASTRIVIVAGSTAEYRVREQLARLNFPNDAVGKTDTLAGQLVLEGDGSIAPGGRLTVDLRNLQSDSGRRDAFIRQNTLHTDRFPNAVFVPRRQQGLPLPLPSSGKAAFTLTGDMTIHGTTSELTWDVAASVTPTTVSGEATTRFPFARFGIAIPKVLGLLSVDDDIRLVLNFKARREPVPADSSSTRQE